MPRHAPASCATREPPSLPTRRLLRQVRACAERLGLEVPLRGLEGLRVVPAQEAPSVRQLVAWGLDADSARFCRRQVQAGDSSFWPQAGLVLLARDDRAHWAEEAAHVLRHALTPLRVPQEPADAFYMRAVEEGLAFFASKLLCPRRPAPDWQRLRGHRAGERVLRTAMAHVQQEGGLSGAAALYPATRACADAVCHLLGYRLGDALYRAHAARLCDAQKVRALFLRTTGGRGEACLLYWQLAGALRDFLSPAGPRYHLPPTPRQERATA